MIENIDICRKCGGKCCKKSGCDYLPSDFNDLSTGGLIDKLSEGNISIVSCLAFKKLPNGKMYATPFLYLRARNINREIVDLLSMKTTCTQLTEEGCKYKYEDRPSMGKNLVPVENNRCHPHKDPTVMIQEWESYQNILARIVKRLTGLTVEERLRQDAEKLFMAVRNEEFEGVAKREILDVRNMMIPLAQAYPEELDRAIKNTQNKIKTYQSL